MNLELAENSPLEFLLSLNKRSAVSENLSCVRRLNDGRDKMSYYGTNT